MRCRHAWASRRWVAGAWHVTALMTFGAHELIAQTSGAPAPRAIGDTVALRTTIDLIVRDAMARLRVPGAAVIVVHQGSVILERGYGVASLASRTAVDPEHTMFGVSSVSKVFTAAAVLQLAERGRLRLTDDVNADIGPWHLPTSFDPPVTISNLLTHTGGFDDLTIGVGARRAADVRPLGAYLASDMPPQVRPPGTVASYSNHGFALAGYVVERASGLPFATYMEQAIFLPLGMTHSSFAQPLPDSLEAARATGYRVEDGGLVPVPRIFFNDGPASALFTTAGDMGLWIRAALALGMRDSTHGGTAVLTPQSFATLQRRQWAHDSALPGLAYGMRERSDLGVRVLEQGGAWEDYSSDLLLSPTEQVGMFLAFNAEAGADMADTVWRAVLRQVRRSAHATAPGADGSWMRWPLARPPGPFTVDDIAGVYRENRYSRHTIARLGVLTGDVQELRVAARNGVPFLDGDRLELIAPDLFRSTVTGHRVAWKAATPTSPPLLFLENGPYEGFERVPWYDRGGANITLVGVVLAGALLSVGRRLWGAVARRRAPRIASADAAAAVRAGASSTATLLDCVVLAFLTATLAAFGATDVWAFQYGMPGVFRVLLLVPWFIGGLALAVCAGVARAARLPGRAMRAEWAQAAPSVVLALALLWFAWHWNLITKL